MPGYREEEYDYNEEEEELDLDDPQLYADIEDKYAPQFTYPLASSLLVDGAPVVGNDKKSKLISAMKKVFDSRGFAVQEMHMPMSSEAEDAQSKGVLFVILKDPSTAAQAAAACDGHRVDKRHTLGIRTFDEVERLNEQVNENFEEPQKEQYRDRVGRMKHVIGYG